MQKISSVIGQCFLKRTKRRTLSISVLPNGAVEIVAPMSAGVPEIQAKIQKRSGWIMRQRRHFIALRVERPVRRYCTGATHRYLGRQYRLKVSKAAKPDVKLRGGYLHISSPSVTSSAVASLLSGWMRGKAKEQFERRILKWRGWCAERRLPEPKLTAAL